MLSPSQGGTPLPTDEGRLEQGLWAAEALIPNGDHLPIWQLIALLKRGGGCGSGHLIFKVQSYIAQFLLDVPDNFTLSCRDTNIRVFTGGKNPPALIYISQRTSGTTILGIQALLSFSPKRILKSSLSLFKVNV